MNSFNENLECLKTVLKRKDLWQDLCDAYKEALCEIADRTRMDYYINKLMSLETGPYKVYIKRTGTQVDKLNTCNMSVTSYTVTFK